MSLLFYSNRALISATYGAGVAAFELKNRFTSAYSEEGLSRFHRLVKMIGGTASGVGLGTLHGLAAYYLPRVFVGEEKIADFARKGVVAGAVYGATFNIGRAFYDFLNGREASELGERESIKSNTFWGACVGGALGAATGALCNTAERRVPTSTPLTYTLFSGLSEIFSSLTNLYTD